MAVDKTVLEGLAAQGFDLGEVEEEEKAQEDEAIEEVDLDQEENSRSPSSVTERISENFNNSRLGKAVSEFTSGLDEVDPENPLNNPGLTEEQKQTIDKNVANSPIGKAIIGDPADVEDQVALNQAATMAQEVLGARQADLTGELVANKALEDANIIKAPSVNQQSLQKDIALVQQERDLASKQEEKTRFDLMAKQNEQRQRSFQMEYEAKVNERLTELEGEASNLRKEIAEQQIDPGRFWSSRTTGQKIGLAISAFFGAGDTIMKLIDRDIEAQKANLNKTQGLYGKVLDRIKNTEDATRATKAMYLQEVAQQFQMRMSKETNEMRRQELGLKAEEYRQRSAKLTMELAQKQVLAQAYKTGVTPQMVAMLPKEEQAKYVPGLNQLAPDADSAKKARELTGNYDSVMNTLEAAISHRKEYGAETLNRKAMATGRSLSNQLTLAVKDAFNLGVLSAQDVELVEGVTGGDLSSIGYIIPKLEAFRDQMRGQYVSRIKSLGLDPNFKQTKNNFRAGL